ncbi:MULTISPECIES: hypothetical protein [Thermoactinomyces]|jgi:hypothetical protein|uniref:Alcohol dehydrogenase-like N-terminal domain-containing protein n=1 Tax=Thermoactinomyces daqus TaxID=1329516 RepID=A0A7W1XCR6_9BACL|nr:MULTISPECIES: hypothetical protein [Thermoactinomyces]MBA4544226.1 hypothetical protein [Thermoactinomyces daqus]MBH8597024.1 hypothetical protein [Thermoactinomyces sp. CICC 10523]MBH8603801.1 hypothetical protein [Thermoactinomyces sp. CICC 10522]MBH8608857.1 hypothetical protein [Thermoactinomyces sp. CICC 10521]
MKNDVFQRDRFSQQNIKGKILPPGTPFIPPFTPLPEWQYAYRVIICQNDQSCRQIKAVRKIVPVAKPKPGQVLLYMLASEVNFNELTGLAHENQPEFTVTGHRGLGLIVATGDDVKRDNGLKVGDMVTVHLVKNPIPSATNTNGPETRLITRLLGTHQQFALSPVTQVTLRNRLWESYWKQKELAIKIIPFANLENEQDGLDDTDLCIIRHAMPRLDLTDSHELFQAWKA